MHGGDHCKTYLVLLILIRCCGPGSHENGLRIYSLTAQRIHFLNMHAVI